MFGFTDLSVFCYNGLLTFLVVQEFVEVTREGLLALIGTQFDGILGLGFQETAVGKATPVWYSSSSLKLLLLNSSYFSFFLHVS